MNIINTMLLKTVMLPKPLYRRFGVNTTQLQTIVTTKLLMDDRRPNTFQQMQRRKHRQETTGASLGTMFLSAILGVMFMFSFFFGNNAITQMTAFFSMFIFILAATLITDFTSVLIDVRDNYIILPKPVDDRTVVVARLLHVLIYICKIVLPMALPGVIYQFYTRGFAAGLVLCILIFLVLLFTLFLINAAYIFILRITTPQKFQKIISYFQIVFAIVIYAGYQVVPRMFSLLENVHIDFSTYPLMVLFPPYWFAVAWNTLVTLSGNGTAILLTIISLVMPVVCMIAVVKYFAPTFNSKLALITSSDGGSTGTTKIAKAEQLRSYSQWLAQLTTKGGAERTGFLFTWKMTTRSKDFKIKVYPYAGYLVVYLFITFYSFQHVSLSAIQQQTGQGRMVITAALYVTVFMTILVLEQMLYSDKFKAAWIFYTMPVNKPGSIIAGAIKSVLLKFYMPLMLLVAGAGFVLIGIQFLPNLLLAIFNTVFISAITFYSGVQSLPFSKPQNIKAQSGNFVKSIFRVLLLGILGFLHYALYAITPVIIILAVLAAIAAWYVMDSIQSITWKKLALEDF